ncbi:hypothetical protein AMECASPLE_030607, partial [Ameca splendens]
NKEFDSEIFYMRGLMKEEEKWSEGKMSRAVYREQAVFTMDYVNLPDSSVHGESYSDELVLALDSFPTSCSQRFSPSDALHTDHSKHFTLEPHSPTNTHAFIHRYAD